MKNTWMLNVIINSSFLLRKTFVKKTSHVLGVISDENFNKVLTKLFEVPIGCASRRLNLAVTDFISRNEDYEKLINKIQNVMVKLRTIERSVALRKKTTLHAIICNDTRWS